MEKSASTVQAPLLSRFQEEMADLLQDRIGTTLIVGAFVFPFFVLEDQSLIPDRWRDVYVLRLTCSLACMLAWAANHGRLARRHVMAFLVVTMAAVSILKSFVTAMDVTGIRSLYFGGHALILVGSLAYLPLSGLQSAIMGAVCLLGYAVPTLLFASAIDHTAFEIQMGLLAAIWIQLSVGCHLNYKMRLREFLFRHKLYQVRRRAEDYGFVTGAEASP